MNPQTLVYIVLLYDGGETSQVICEKQISILGNQLTFGELC